MRSALLAFLAGLLACAPAAYSHGTATPGQESVHDRLMGHAGFGRKALVLGGEVRVLTPKGELIARGRSNRHGVFLVDSERLARDHVKKRLLLEVRGGKVRRERFRGTLRVVVPRYRGLSDISLNPVTTVIAEYVDRYGAGLDRAERRVRRALSLPEGPSLHMMVNHTNIAFDGTRLLAKAQRRGEFDTWVRRIARRAKRGGRPVDLGRGVPAARTSASGAGAAQGVMAVLTAAGKYCQASGVGSELISLSHKLGFKDSQCSVHEKLDQVLEQLEYLQTQIAALQVASAELYEELRGLIKDEARRDYEDDVKQLGGLQTSMERLITNLNDQIALAAGKQGKLTQTPWRLASEYDAFLADIKTNVLSKLDVFKERTLGNLSLKSPGAYDHAWTYIVDPTHDLITNKTFQDYEELRGAWVAAWEQFVFLQVNYYTAQGHIAPAPASAGQKRKKKPPAPKPPKSPPPPAPPTETTAEAESNITIALRSMLGYPTVDEVPMGMAYDANDGYEVLDFGSGAMDGSAPGALWTRNHSCGVLCTGQSWLDAMNWYWVNYTPPYGQGPFGPSEAEVRRCLSRDRYGNYDANAESTTPAKYGLHPPTFENWDALLAKRPSTVRFDTWLEQQAAAVFGDLGDNHAGGFYALPPERAKCGKDMSAPIFWDYAHLTGYPYDDRIDPNLGQRRSRWTNLFNMRYSTGDSKTIDQVRLDGFWVGGVLSGPQPENPSVTAAGYPLSVRPPFQRADGSWQVYDKLTWPAQAAIDARIEEYKKNPPKLGEEPGYADPETVPITKPVEPRGPIIPVGSR